MVVQIVVVVLQVLMTLMSAWLLLLLVYQIIVSFFGYGKKTKDYEDHAPETRFLVLIPAHNEEAVISGIIENMRHMNYPSNLYDFYVLADNCDDNTAGVAREMGAKVLESHKESPDAPTGKPIVLQKALQTLKGYQDKYDMVMFFDADNLADPDLFREVNSQFIDHDRNVDFIQCYLGCKNNKGLVAVFYYITYTITNRFFQLAKNRLQLNNVIGGTGFAVTTSYLYARGGWTAMSLTEDLETQIEATAEGRRILWNHSVRIYDEKPTSWRASFRQRTRWAQGHWFVAFKNTGRMLGSLLKGRISFSEFFSTFLYMYSLTPYVVLVLQLFFTLLLQIFAWTGLLPPARAAQGSSATWIMNIPSILIFLYANLYLFFYADRRDNGQRFSVKMALTVLWSMLINYLLIGAAQLLGLIKHKKQNVWVKTEHKISHEQDECVQVVKNPPTADAPQEMDDDQVKMTI